MMMILGMFVFKRRTLPFQSMTQESAYRWGRAVASVRARLSSFWESAMKTSRWWGSCTRKSPAETPRCRR